ncbi:hypothetical protein BDF19DRAFT_454224, partial [Syncephalis fuscata]
MKSFGTYICLVSAIFIASVVIANAEPVVIRRGVDFNVVARRALSAGSSTQSSVSTTNKRFMQPSGGFIVTSSMPRNKIFTNSSMVNPMPNFDIPSLFINNSRPNKLPSGSPQISLTIRSPENRELSEPFSSNKPGKPSKPTKPGM